MMALKATQGLLYTGYYPSSLPLSSPTFRKQLTQSWCKLVQNHRLSKFCDQRLTIKNNISTVTTTLLLPSSSSSSSSSSPPTKTTSSMSLTRLASSSVTTVSPLSTTTATTGSCSLDQLDDQQFRSMFQTWDTQIPPVKSSNDEPLTGRCPFSGSKGFPSSSSGLKQDDYNSKYENNINKMTGNSINNHYHHLKNQHEPHHHYLHHQQHHLPDNNSNRNQNISINSNNYYNKISDHKSVKSFDDLPTPKSYPIVGTTLTLMAFGGAAHLHEYCDSRHKELGPIYREKLGPTDCVFIADSSMVQKVYSNEGRFPNHLVPEAWTIYNEMTGIKRGLFFMDGPEWEKRRKGLNKIFLCQPVISDYTEAFNQVVTDVISQWSKVTDQNLSSNPSRSGLLTQLERELYNWSIESLGTMIFGRRLGCVETSDELNCKTHRMENVHLFVQCVQQLFVESAKMTLLPARLAQRFNLPVWQRFMSAADQALNLARGYVEENVAATRNDPENSSRGVLEMLLAQPRIDQDELIRIIIDLFLAAADTTSHATQWALYLLSKNPEYQQKILEQVESVVGVNGTVQAEHLKHFTLVKGVIKETLRLYPVAPFISRKLDRDIVLGGYHIPANSLIAISLYTTGRDEKYWSDAKSFKPERWIREETNRKIVNSHASLPFGFGIRSCVGRRVAEVQMQFLLSRIIQKFYLEPGNAQDIGIKLRMITTPESPIHLRLIDRSKV